MQAEITRNVETSDILRIMQQSPCEKSDILPFNSNSVQTNFNGHLQPPFIPKVKT